MWGPGTRGPTVCPAPLPGAMGQGSFPHRRLPERTLAKHSGQCCPHLELMSGSAATSQLPSATCAHALITALQVMAFAALSSPACQARRQVQAAIAIHLTSMIAALWVMVFCGMSSPLYQPRGQVQAAICHPSRQHDRGAVGDGILLHCPLRHFSHEAKCKLSFPIPLASMIAAL